MRHAFLKLANGRHIRRGFLAAVCVLVLSVLMARMAGAQPDPHTDARLQLAVHLEIGETTLEAVTKALSEQTGMQVEAAVYLRPRKLILQLAGVSITTALDTLAELYDWRWIMPSPGHVLLTRKRVQLPPNVAAVAPAIQAALPVDIRRFFGIGVPIDQIPVDQHPAAFANRTKFSEPWEYGETLKARMMDRLKGRSQRELQLLSPSPGSPLLPEQGKYEGAKLYYPQWTVRQRDAMMIWMLINVTESNSSDVLLGTLPPFVLDINAAHLEVQGTYLFVRSRILFDGGKLEHSESFGVQMPKDEPLSIP